MIINSSNFGTAFSAAFDIFRRPALAALAHIPAFELTIPAIVDVLPCFLQLFDRVAQEVIRLCSDLLLHFDAFDRSLGNLVVVCPVLVLLDCSVAVLIGHGKWERFLLFRRRVLEEPELSTRKVFYLLVAFSDHFAFFPNSM